jgi:hypothetical protein
MEYRVESATIRARDGRTLRYKYVRRASDGKTECAYAHVPGHFRGSTEPFKAMAEAAMKAGAAKRVESVWS